MRRTFWTSWLGWTLIGAMGINLETPGETVSIVPKADTTLIETAPTNNLGGAPFVNAGTTQNHTRNHGLFQFDIAGAIPAGATITAASLTLTVIHQPNAGYAPGTFDLHRVLRPWGEGNKTAPMPTNPGLGARATLDEATWTHRFALTTNTWAIPGAQVGADYAGVVSAEQSIYDVGNSPYTFNSTTQMVADVQSWLDHPTANFGWMLLVQDESIAFTARRFGSREDPNNAPLLSVTYLPPLRIERVGLQGNRFAIQFSSQIGTAYVIQSRNSLTSGTWQDVTDFTAFSSVTVLTVDPVSAAQKYFRLGRR